MLRFLASLPRHKFFMIALTLVVAFATATLASSASATPMKGKAVTSYARPTPSWVTTQPSPIEKGKKPSTITVTEEPKPIDGEDMASTCDTVSQYNAHGRSGGWSSYASSGWSMLVSMLPGGGFSINWMEWTSSSGDWWENEYDSGSQSCNDGYGKG